MEEEPRGEASRDCVCAHSTMKCKTERNMDSTAVHARLVLTARAGNNIPFPNTFHVSSDTDKRTQHFFPTCMCRQRGVCPPFSTNKNTRQCYAKPPLLVNPALWHPSKQQTTAHTLLFGGSEGTLISDVVGTDIENFHF